MKNNTLVVILLLIVVAGAAFFVGIKYQQTKENNFAGQFANRSGRMMGGQLGTNRQGFRPVNGEIINADDKSITVKLTDGSSKIVLFTDKTIINKASQAGIGDLKTGEKVAVFGQQNADGSVTAQNIQLNPLVRNAMNGGTPRPQ